MRNLGVFRRWVRKAGIGSLPLLIGCVGQQSALDPAGDAAERIADLFWQMSAGAVVIWSVVLGLAVLAMYRRAAEPDARFGRWLIVGGGVVLPAVVLAGLLVYGLAMLPPLLAAAPPGSLQVHVTGEQYWWRVRYAAPSGETVELANELRLPVGEHTQFILDSRDVIHSFWIPSLGGKMDMIPGRTTRLSLRPTRKGELRGVCAEYCGTSHALMSLRVRVLDRAELDAWLAREAGPARVPSDGPARRGAELFAENGCGACHNVRGTAARGSVGPDLTHVGSRLSLGAGMLQNTHPELVRWLRDLDELKPGSSMPHYAQLKAAELDMLASYLESLQ